MIADISHPKTQHRMMANVCEKLNDFIRGSGVEVTSVTISSVKVVKQGENQTIGLFQQLLASDMGKQLVGALGAHAAELLGQTPGDVNTNDVGKVRET
jgi:hypothetical protein